MGLMAMPKVFGVTFVIGLEAWTSFVSLTFTEKEIARLTIWPTEVSRPLTAPALFLGHVASPLQTPVNLREKFPWGTPLQMVGIELEATCLGEKCFGHLIYPLWRMRP